MPCFRKWVTSGNVTEAIEYFAIRTPKQFKPDFGEKAIRSKNVNVTSEQQQKINNRNAVNYLCRLINANFKIGDLWLTFDFEVEPLLENGERDKDAVIAIMEKYHRKLRGLYKKSGLVFKRIYGIEVENIKGPVRMHVHEILPRFSADAVINCFVWGGVTLRTIDGNGDFIEFAQYLSKDPTLGTDNKKRYFPSKNLAKPKVKVKKIKYPGGQIKTPKGYKLIIDTPYVSDITGMIRYVRFVKYGVDYSVSDYATVTYTSISHRRGPEEIPVFTQRE